MSTSASTSTDPSFEKVEEYDTEQLINYLRTKILNFVENDFTILRDQSINGQAFVTMSQEEFSKPPFNFVYGKARNLSNLIIGLNAQRLLNLEEYLSYTIPYIAYSPHDTTSKSSTKVSGDSPIEVRLWDEFFNDVNSRTFDQEKKFQRPTFVTDFIKTYEEIVRQAFNTNVCMVLNRVMQDVQFALRKVGGTGDPDYCCHLQADDKLLYTIEIKRFNVLITNDRKIPDLFNDKKDLNLAPKVRQIIQQLYNYMVENNLKYSVVSTYNDHWFVKRERGILYISEAVKHSSTHPSTLKSYAYLVELAKNDTYSSDPRIIEKADDSPYSFRKHRRDDHDDHDDYDDSSSSRNPSEKSKQSSSKQSSSTSKRSSSTSERSSSGQSYSSTQKKRKQNMEAQRFNYRDFKYNSILSAGENNKKVLECEFRGKTIVLKSTDLTKKPKCLDEFLNEVKIYKVLAKLQGIYIPELLFYGDLANGMSFVMGMTIVGTTLDHHRINRRLKGKAITALKKVHKYNVLHNDIRKENILIDEKGYVYLIDFGLSIPETYDEDKFREEEDQLERLLESYM